MKISLICVFLCFSFCVRAQLTTCAQTLRLANSVYAQGRLHELPHLMKKCLQNGFSKQEKLTAYKLLALAYIYLEEPDSADQMMLNILKTDNYFRPNKEIDPAEFVALYNTFQTQPIYRLGLKFSLNATQPNVTQFNPISDGTTAYNSKNAVGFGVATEILLPVLHLKNKITISAEAYYLPKSYVNQSNSILSGSVYSTSTGIESQNWIAIPLMLQYRLFKKDELEYSPRFIRSLNPYVALGVSGDYLLGSSTSVDQKRIGNQSINVSTFTLAPQRERINVSAIAGVGIKYRVAKGFFVAEARYSYGLTKINSPSTLYANQVILNNYKLTDGIFKLNSLLFNVGYVQNFFNPKKLKRKA